MSAVPQARNRLYVLAEAYQERDPVLSADLLDCARLLHRERAVRRAPPQRRRVTADIGADVRQFAAEHPELDIMTIGLRFNVGTGRVSEILTGKRGR